jgi:hypothetical protein
MQWIGMYRLSTMASFASLFAFCACAQPAERVIIGKQVRAFHEDVLRGENIELQQPNVRDAAVFVELIGLSNLAKVNALRVQIRRAAGIKNAIGYSGDGFRTIVYDPVWAASATADFYLVLSHEAGHFFCGHENLPQSPEIELEADRFGGASIRRYEIYNQRSFFPAIIAAASEKYPENATAFYPSRAKRLEALRTGYQEGSRCGDLATVQRP